LGKDNFSHEILDHSMEFRAFVSKAQICPVILFTSGESTEILYSFRDGLGEVLSSIRGASESGNPTHTAKEAHFNCIKKQCSDMTCRIGKAGRTSSKIFVAMLDVEVDLVGDLGTFGSLHRLRTEYHSRKEETQ
jgi:hypothetical protein